MPMHASWKGHLKISLVAIPVQAFTAAAGAESSELALHQLHKSCKNRIQYKKFCPIHGEVQLFLFDKPEKMGMLKRLVHMITGEFGFCPKCLEKNFVK